MHGSSNDHQPLRCAKRNVDDACSLVVSAIYLKIVSRYCSIPKIRLMHHLIDSLFNQKSTSLEYERARFPTFIFLCTVVGSSKMRHWRHAPQEKVSIGLSRTTF